MFHVLNQVFHEILDYHKLVIIQFTKNLILVNFGTD